MLDMQRKLTAPFYMILSLPSTAMGFALSVQIAALSWILTTQYDLDIHQVGFVWAAGPLAGILGQVIIGVISDKVWFWNGRRRPFILIGGVLASLMLLALPNIDVISSSMGIAGLLGVAITVALVLDLSINVSFNPTRSIITDVTPEGEERTRGYTWMQTISGSFGVLAYGVGAVWGNYVLIYFGALLVFVLSVFPIFMVEEPKELNEQSQVANDKVNWLEMWMNIRPLWGFFVYDMYAMGMRIADMKTDHYYVEIAAIIWTAYLVITTLLADESKQTNIAEKGDLIGFKKVLAAHSFSWLGVQTMFVFIFAYLQDKMTGISDANLGQVISISFLILSGVAALLPAFVLEPLVRKVGRVKVHTYCIASMAIGYGLVAIMGETKNMLYVLMALLAIGWSAIISLAFAIMSEKVPQNAIGKFMGLFNLSVVLPQLLVSLGVGLFISQAEDKAIVFQISAVALAISAVAWLFVKDSHAIENQETKQKPEPEQTETVNT